MGGKRGDGGYGSKLALIGGTLLVALLLLEVVVRLFDLDAESLWNTLFYVEGDFAYEHDAQIVRPSDDPRRLYELIPGARATCTNCTHPLERRYDRTRISVNRLGFRGEERAAQKPPGVIRVVVLGGSNTFGLTVSDEDTYPAQMQRILDARYPGRYEVWNAGVSAYVMSQKIAYAETILAQYSPDLVIIQDNNFGRRAFYYYDVDYPRHFDANPELFVENIPLLVSRDEEWTNLHDYLVRGSAVYRFVLARLNLLVVERALGEAPGNGRLASGFNRGLLARFDAYGSLVNERETLRFVEAHPEQKILILDTVLGLDCPEETPSLTERERQERKRTYCAPKYLSQHPRLACHSLCHGDRPAEYREIHPPSYVYRAYAEQLVDELLETGILGRPQPMPWAEPREPAQAATAPASSSPAEE